MQINYLSIQKVIKKYYNIIFVYKVKSKGRAALR
jgi:hypothetical protein